MSVLHVRLRVANEHYSLPVEQVREVAELGDMTPVPGSPSEILGVRNLRGEVIPVVALARMLGLREDEPRRVVVAETSDLRAGLAVEEVLDVGELSGASEPVESPFLLGSALVGGELIGILDLEAVLAAIAPHEGSA